MSIFPSRLTLPWLAIAIIFALIGCRQTFDPAVQDSTGEDGGPGFDYSVQCSGWFPDWIVRAAPAEGADTFRLAQGYPVGVPVFNSNNELTHWEPLSPFTSAPWLAFDFTDPDERLSYANALKEYALSDLAPYDFVPQNSSLGKKHWYHVPMMTSGFFPREPYHGLTRERGLRASEQSWLNSNVGAFGIGLYNNLGGYTIGQVFHDPEPSNADPSKSHFIDGTLVVKILFAEYDPAAITGPDPLANSPAWFIQDPLSPSNATFEVRLLQMDIAVKDPRSTQTGWVFATYVYNQSLPAASPLQRWYNMTPVGLAWGNDPDVTFDGDPDLDESWINPAVPAPFNGQVGLHGRLNGPVDNPASACMSCHSTAQIREGQTSVGAYTAAKMVPESSCTATEKQYWFRNISGTTPFGQMVAGPDYCQPASPALSSPPMQALDYSLQVQRGLVNGVALNHANPCLEHIPPDHLPEMALSRMALTAGEQDSKSAHRDSQYVRAPLQSPLRPVDKVPSWEAAGMAPQSSVKERYPRR